MPGAEMADRPNPSGQRALGAPPGLVRLAMAVGLVTVVGLVAAGCGGSRPNSPTGVTTESPTQYKAQFGAGSTYGFVTPDGSVYCSDSFAPQAEQIMLVCASAAGTVAMVENGVNPYAFRMPDIRRSQLGSGNAVLGYISSSWGGIAIWTDTGQYFGCGVSGPPDSVTCTGCAPTGSIPFFIISATGIATSTQAGSGPNIYWGAPGAYKAYAAATRPRSG